MSDTPRTDQAVIAIDHVTGEPMPYVAAEFARRLERELAAMECRAKKAEHQLVARCECGREVVCTLLSRRDDCQNMSTEQTA